MLKFFRALRKNLLSEGKTTKYFQYAIGEIILVVIGILIALQINTWNQNRQDRIQEQQVLSQLLNEYNNNLSQLNQKIEIRDEIIKSSFKILSYRTIERETVEADSFNLHLSRLITRPTFDPELGVTNELTSSGKLYLIQNPQLRNRIASFSSALSELREEEMVIFQNSEERIQPFITKHYQLGRVLTEFLNDDVFREKFTMVKANDILSFKDLLKEEDFSQLLDHPDLEDHISNMISNTIYTNEQSEGVKVKIEEVIVLIKNEIDK